MDINQAHHAVNRVVRPVVSDGYRDGKIGGRVGLKWRDAKVDKGKECGSVGRSINEIFEKIQVTAKCQIFCRLASKDRVHLDLSAVE